MAALPSNGPDLDGQLYVERSGLFGTKTDLRHVEVWSQPEPVLLVRKSSYGPVVARVLLRGLQLGRGRKRGKHSYFISLTTSDGVKRSTLTLRTDTAESLRLWFGTLEIAARAETPDTTGLHDISAPAT